MRSLVLLTLTACGFQGPFAGVGDGGTIDSPPQVDAATTSDIDSGEPDAPVIIAVDAGIMADAHVPDAIVVIHDAPAMTPDANPWPCGPEPATPGASITFGNSTTGMTASAISLNNAQRLVVTPGESLALHFAYALHDSACASCIDQIEYGFVQGTTGDRIGCAFDATLQNQMANATTPTETFLAPTTPGQYDLRLAQAENYGCNYKGASNWYAGSPPPAAQTIATICVH